MGVAAVAVAAGIGWKLTSPGPLPPPPDVKDVTPPELAAAIAESEKPAKKDRPKPAQTPAKTSPSASVNIDRTGMNTLQFSVANPTPQGLSISYEAGEIFDDGKAPVVILKSLAMEVPPGATDTKDVPVAAISSNDRGLMAKFSATSRQEPRLAPLIRHLEMHPDIPLNIVQVAVLAITEDAPLQLFARFPVPSAASKDTELFKVRTVDLVAALALLRDAGVSSCRLLADAQLKVEAMIDPEAHAAAASYYSIDPKTEWLYWRHELLDGNPSTRHYALYGIARFYPDVALQMMPRWALETRLAPHFRRAAIGSLALTRRFEAAPILQALERDLAREKELAQCVTPALRYLERNISNAL
jgi:hypothetical protein